MNQPKKNEQAVAKKESWQRKEKNQQRRNQEDKGMEK